jgi:hypothetical protein
MTRDETLALLVKRTPDGNIRARVDASAVLGRLDFQPLGDRYVRSVWTAFDGKPEQSVHLVLKRDSSGFWYWSGALLQAPD